MNYPTVAALILSANRNRAQSSSGFAQLRNGSHQHLPFFLVFVEQTVAVFRRCSVFEAIGPGPEVGISVVCGIAASKETQEISSVTAATGAGVGLLTGIDLSSAFCA